MATQNQDRLRSHFASLDSTPTAQGTGWDSLWETAAFLPWDRGYANPALIDLLANPSSPPTSSATNPTPGAPAPRTAPAISLPAAVQGGKRKKALVPGCGKGYDVALFSAYGFDAVGLEVSKHAAKAAEEYLASAGSGSSEGEYEGKDNGEGKGKAVCVVGDFFEDAWLEELGVGKEGGFDLIYDNTVCSDTIEWCDGMLTCVVSLRAAAFAASRLGEAYLFPPSEGRKAYLPRVPHTQARVLGRPAVVAPTDCTHRAAQAAGRGDIV